MIKNKTIYGIILLINIAMIFFYCNTALSFEEDPTITGDKLILEEQYIDDNENSYYFLQSIGNAYLKYHEIIIKGDQAEFNSANSSIFFDGNVKLQNNDYLMQGSKLEGNLIDEIFTMSGGVNLSGPDLSINSQKLKYDNKLEKAVLKGEVNGSYKEYKFSTNIVNIDLKKKNIQFIGKAKLIIPDKGKD